MAFSTSGRTAEVLEALRAVGNPFQISEDETRQELTPAARELSARVFAFGGARGQISPATHQASFLCRCGSTFTALVPSSGANEERFAARLRVFAEAHENHAPAFRLVKQPDGKLARWIDRSASFDRTGLSEVEAIEALLVDKVPPSEAVVLTREVLGGKCREWDLCLATFEAKHGPDLTKKLRHAATPSSVGPRAS